MTPGGDGQDDPFQLYFLKDLIKTLNFISNMAIFTSLSLLTPFVVGMEAGESEFHFISSRP